IVLAHVVPIPGDSKQDVEERAAVERMAQRLRDLGLDAEAVVEHGPIAEGILRVAQQTRADLVALTPHQRGLLEGIWRSDIVGQLFAELSLPALLTPPTAAPSSASQRSVHLLSDPIASVIVPLDGSELAERALPYALAFAEEYHRPLLLVRVVKPIVLYLTAETSAFQVETDEEHEHEALRYLRDTRTHLARQATQPVQTTLRIGQPADEIRRLFEAHAGSLLVMSTHGHTGVSRAIMGSVATAVMRHALGPLLIIPPHCPPLAREPADASAHMDAPTTQGK
ncbi:MAG TPA: universal stress protein, partial [Ktedonobacterales bacterium]|nr:universal stress protein [Ktedonobacterales bacterium]